MFVRTAFLRTIFLFFLIGTGTYMVLKADLVLGLISLSFIPFAGWRSIEARLKLRSSWYKLQEKMSKLWISEKRPGPKPTSSSTCRVQNPDISRAHTPM